MQKDLIYKNDNQIFHEVKGETPYLVFPIIEDTKIVRHGFTTKQGGVSTGVYESLNLSYTRGDDPKLVTENFERIAKAVGFETSNLVFSDQTHTTNVRHVTENDRGNGFLFPTKFTDVDGLITNEPGLVLATFYADCVPLFFVDPKTKSIGLSHSGWRGTVDGIGKETVLQMSKTFGSVPSDIIVGIGPSICPECYEVGDDVIDYFRQSFPPFTWDMLYKEKDNGKYNLDLWNANVLVLLDAGIHPSNIAVTNLCTYCNDSRFYSHRKMGDHRGQMAAFLELI